MWRGLCSFPPNTRQRHWNQGSWGQLAAHLHPNELAAALRWCKLMNFWLPHSCQSRGASFELRFPPPNFATSPTLNTQTVLTTPHLSPWKSLELRDIFAKQLPGTKHHTLEKNGIGFRWESVLLVLSVRLWRNTKDIPKSTFASDRQQQRYKSKTKKTFKPHPQPHTAYQHLHSIRATIRLFCLDLHQNASFYQHLHHGMPLQHLCSPAGHLCLLRVSFYEIIDLGKSMVTYK